MKSDWTSSLFKSVQESVHIYYVTDVTKLCSAKICHLGIVMSKKIS